MNEKFIFTGQLPRFTLGRASSRTRSYVILKLIAYMMFEGSLKDGSYSEFRDKPDLHGIVSPGEPEIWVDCCPVSDKKISFYYRRRKRFSLFFFKKSRASLVSLEKKLSKQSVDAVIYGFETEFINKLSHALYRKNSLRCSISGGIITITLNKSKCSSAVHSNILKAL